MATPPTNVTPCEARCADGRFFITEDEHVALLEATEGTGQPTSVSFGLHHVWVMCPFCSPETGAKRKVLVDTLRTLMDIRKAP